RFANPVVNSAVSSVTFLDRSLIGGYAYCILGNVQVPESILKDGKNRYQKVFLLERLEVYVTDQARIETENEALAIHDEIRKAYVTFGYEPVSVPVLSPEERVKFILDWISEGKGVEDIKDRKDSQC